MGLGDTIHLPGNMISRFGGGWCVPIDAVVREWSDTIGAIFLSVLLPGYSYKTCILAHANLAILDFI